MPDQVPPAPSASQKSDPESEETSALAPDHSEVDFPLDNIIPTRGYQMTPMIGLGGSAGCIGALQRFFSLMPPDSGMVFVVVLHLAPEHESILDSILASTTRMPVVQATNGCKVETNTVYVIPPGAHLSTVDGHLQLTELEPERGKRVAVDFFFRSLADTHGPHATAIVLSGADGDGAIGIKRIKERGGLTIAQDPEEAEHRGMPQAAMATGMVDWVLPVSDIPARLVEYYARERQLHVMAEEGPSPAASPKASADENETALRDVLAYLRARTGRDFSYYKRATVVRRISRRLQINSIDDLPSYVDFLRTHPGETGALLQDLLISVTNFFRDREAFQKVESFIPELFKDKRPSDYVRVWIPACATGEEAYSLAILLLEHCRELDNPPSLQIFGCDLDEAAIQVARAGIYPEAISGDVNDERLRRYFLKESGGYRVRREVREIVLFAAHDLLKDAPFSRMDLISCRNLMIYLNREAQKRAMEIFHFALRQHGILFLGSSETVDGESPLFQVEDKQHRIYRRAIGHRVSLPVSEDTGTLTRALLAQEHVRGGPFLPKRWLSHLDTVPIEMERSGRSESKLSLSELHLRLLERFAPPSLVVNAEHDVVHLSENAGAFLRLGAGEPTRNLIRIVHPMLRVPLRGALFQASESGEVVIVSGIPVDVLGTMQVVDIRVSPAGELAPGFLLVVIHVREELAVADVMARPLESEPVVRQLEREIEIVRGRLRDTIEQYEANAEELKAGNEELRAMNEELHSASEELETSREELQSINEELTTVNSELKSKLEELSHSNSDLHNLMGATAIPTIFLDRDLRIMRYTPKAAGLFSVIPSDLGRPLADLRHHIDYPDLAADAVKVLENLAPIEKEVRAGDKWYLTRILPYRTLDDRIAGVVLAFVDITEGKAAHEAQFRSEERLRLVLESVTDYAIFTLDPKRRVSSWNSGAQAIFGYSEQEIVGQLGDILFIPEDRERGDAEQEVTTAARVGRAANERWHSRKDGTKFYGSGVVSPIRAEGGEISGFVKILRDLTETKRAQEALLGSEERLRLIVENASEYAIISMDSDRRVISWNLGAQSILGHTQAEAIGKSADMIFTPQDRMAGVPLQEVNRALAEGRAADERWHIRKDGSTFWGSGVMTPMQDPSGQAIGFVKIFRDETPMREARQALEKTQSDLLHALEAAEMARKEAEATGRAKDHFLAILSHELRTPLTPILMAIAALQTRDDLSETVKDALEMIERNIQMEARFIDDLLDLTRISRGRFELQSGLVNIHTTVKLAAEVTRSEIEEKRQTLVVKLEATHHCTMGDAARLQQVFWNLLKNASKFTPPEGTIHMTTRNAGGRIRVEIKDTGIGFESSVGLRLFEAFEQADESISKNYGGLGLGLAISKAIIEGHGGKISAFSDGPHRGAVFTVELPLSEE